LLRLIAILFIFCGSSESGDSPTVVFSELLNNQITKFSKLPNLEGGNSIWFLSQQAFVFNLEIWIIWKFGPVF
jgi:hypothetical protein